MKRLTLMDQIEIEGGNWYDREKEICCLTKKLCDYVDGRGIARIGWCDGCCRAG